MPETVVTDKTMESSKSVFQLNVLAAKNMGNTATQGEQLNIMNSEKMMALSENFEWLWSWGLDLNLPIRINVIPMIIKMSPEKGSAKVSAYFAILKPRMAMMEPKMHVVIE